MSIVVRVIKTLRNYPTLTVAFKFVRFEFTWL